MTSGPSPRRKPAREPKTIPASRVLVAGLSISATFGLMTAIALGNPPPKTKASLTPSGLTDQSTTTLGVDGLAPVDPATVATDPSGAPAPTSGPGTTAAAPSGSPAPSNATPKQAAPPSTTKTSTGAPATTPVTPKPTTPTPTAAPKPPPTTAAPKPPPTPTTTTKPS